MFLISIFITVITNVAITKADVHTIRYAKYNTSSPLGPWAPSIVNEDWESDGNITDPVWCIQSNTLTEEADETGMVGTANDCLLLRIFRPGNNFSANNGNGTNTTLVSDGDELLPVMLWLHGGMYLLGSGVSEDLYYGGFLADKENIIVISINYRLGAHGFLGYNGTHGDTINNGVLDQRNAIEWTSKFIQAFGGDPNKITLAGESAGATSVNVHMANPNTNLLFDKAILESNPGGINLKPSSDQVALFRKLAEEIGCARENDDDALECLVSLYRNKPDGISEIIKASSSVAYTNSPLLELDVWMSFYTWAPSVDEKYIFGQPNHIVVETWPSTKAVLIGTNEEEGRFFLDMICKILEGIAGQIIFGDLFIKCDGNSLYDHTLYRNMVLLAYGTDRRKIDDYYKFVWHESNEDMDDAIEQFSLLVTDSVFTCPNYDMAMGLGQNNTYFYRYGVDAICSVATNTEDCEGFSCHGDEIATVFGTWGVPAVAAIGDCTTEKVTMLNPYVEAVQSQWGNFIREGKPSASEISWDAVYDKDGPVYFFEQSYDEEVGREPSTRESVFTTHHTEQKHTAQEVCTTWRNHTYKTETHYSNASDVLMRRKIYRSLLLLTTLWGAMR